MEEIVRLQEIIEEAKAIIARLEGQIVEAGNEKYSPILISSLPFSDNSTGTRIINVCHQADVRTVKELLRYLQHDFKRWRNSGQKCVDVLRETLKEHLGIDWK